MAVFTFQRPGVPSSIPTAIQKSRALPRGFWSLVTQSLVILIERTGARSAVFLARDGVYDFEILDVVVEVGAEG